MAHPIRTLLGAIAAAALLQGCAGQQTMYRWGGYDTALYAHYKNPQDRETFVAGLRVVIDEAEQRGERVPPGCYAEYGYALYEEARYDDAVRYFGRERERWPESTMLMQKMIANAERQGAKGSRKSSATTPASTGPAGALERR
jgi:hypothetical protein